MNFSIMNKNLKAKSTTNQSKFESDKPLYNKVLGITNDFLAPVIVKYMEKTLDPSLYRGSTVFAILNCNVKVLMT